MKRDESRAPDRANSALLIDARHIYRQVDRARREWTPAQIGFDANLVRLDRGEALDLTLGGDEPNAKLDEIFSSPSPAGRGKKGEGSRRDGRGQRTEKVRVIDWENPAANDFLLVSQFSVTGALYPCRPDLAGFVNGLPLVGIELKKPGVPAGAAFDESLTHYKAEIPQLSWFNAPSERRMTNCDRRTDRTSTLGLRTSHFSRLAHGGSAAVLRGPSRTGDQRIEREDEPRRVSLEVMLRGTCDRSRLLDLVENLTLFSEHKAGLVKIIGQDHQFLGVNNAIASMPQIRGSSRREEALTALAKGKPSLVTTAATGEKVIPMLCARPDRVFLLQRVQRQARVG